MCGIVAIYSQTGVDRKQLNCASAAVAHRGPDAHGIWVSRSETCGLESRRLSLNDLAGGNQPLTAASGLVTAVVNGEFYDFDRIRDELAARGHKLLTRSDSEILLPLYLDHGLSCLDHLRGEFAFALWDERSQSLFAARDRFGIKPLFYGWVGNALVIASEIKALFAAGLNAVWDSESFVDHLMLCHGPSRTLFRGVRQLPPGHFLKVMDGVITTGRYWDLDFPLLGETNNECNFEEIVERLRGELDTAVRLRMRADVPVGCFLSGGIDSASVLALATSASSVPTAFTVQFDDAAYDESALARETAAFNGAPLHTIPVTFDDMVKAWEETVWHAETIGDNGRGAARLLQSHAVKAAGFKAVLSGEGADEILGGYFFARHDFLRSEAALTATDRGRIESIVSATPLAFQSSISGKAVNSIECLESTIGFTPSWIYGALTHRGHAIQTMLNPHFEGEAVTDRVLARVLHDLGGAERLRGRHPVHQSLYFWIKTMLVNMILVADRLEMAAPIESRIPFLDHHLVAVARDIPVPMLFAKGVEKYPLRLAMRDKVPASVFDRPKQPFTAPHAMLSQWNPMREFIGDLLHGVDLKDCPFFEPGAVEGLFNQFDRLEPRAQVPTDQALMLVAHACLLQRSFRPSL